MLKRVEVPRLDWYFQVVLVLSFFWVPAFAQQPKGSFGESQNTVQVLIDQAYPYKKVTAFFTFKHVCPCGGGNHKNGGKSHGGGDSGIV